MATDPPSPQAAYPEAEPIDRLVAGILDNVLDAVITIDVQQRIRLFNRAAGSMFGYEPASMLGQPLACLIPTEARALHAQMVGQFAATGASARAMGATQMLTGLRSDGTEFAIQASISRAGEGAGVLMTAVIRDAAEQRALERAREAYVAAEAAHRAKTDFMSRMSHELRTPLNAVLGMTRLVQASALERLSEQEREQLRLVLTAGERLRALIDDMLALGVHSVQSPAVSSPPSNTHPTGHVLYIEDDPVNALLVTELLRCWPAVRVTVAEDGASGLSLAHTEQPDLVLLDMHLPDLHGLQVLKRLREQPSTRHIRVAALSASATGDQVAAALAAGAARYWTKPIDFGPFLAGMRQLLPSSPAAERP
ncbi:response regulator [Piscinibacter sp. HJYY11]|uniref:ATP-binding response regulator n=1 Tax=Piscinibacter sp. HJYY11 TaxID=2801333 RepID=UPI00191CD02C|nr:response regulator [Piscinibacter sp. HJYY11]MBL0726574.1 response regulator [Piscinibacter sp. HJYY11]